MSDHRLNMDKLHPLGAQTEKQLKTTVSTYRSALGQHNFNGRANHYYVGFFNINHIEEKMWNQTSD